MCYTGGPRCYSEASKRFDNAKQKLRENPKESKLVEKLIEAKFDLDTTTKGQQKLKENIAQISRSINTHPDEEVINKLSAKRRELRDRLKKGEERYNMLMAKHKNVGTKPDSHAHAY